jgi:hypothetical protein
MGISSSKHSFVPDTALECFSSDGSFDLSLYYLYRRKRNCKNQKIFSTEDLDEILMNCFIDADEQDFAKPKQNGTSKRSINLIKLEDGTIQELESRHSSWYVTYVLSPRVDGNRFLNKFQRRFWCSFSLLHQPFGNGQNRSKVYSLAKIICNW